MMLRAHLLRRRASMSRDALHGILLRDAAAFACTIPGIRGYCINAVVDESHRLRIPPGQFKLDAISHMWFDDLDGIRRAEQSPPYRQLQELLQPILESSVALNVTQRKMVEPPRCGNDQNRLGLHSRICLLKRMSILRRDPALSADAFQQTWENEHGPRVSAHAELLGYIQDAVHSSTLEHDLRHNEPPSCDGITELWFADIDAMERVLPPSVPSDVTNHAARIIAHISTFLVREVHFF